MDAQTTSSKLSLSKQFNSIKKCKIVVVVIVVVVVTVGLAAAAITWTMFESINELSFAKIISFVIMF